MTIRDERIKTSVYLSRPVHDALKRRAIEMRLRDTAVMEMAISQYLGHSATGLLVTPCPVCGVPVEHCEHVRAALEVPNAPDFQGIAEELREISDRIRKMKNV